MNIAKTNDKVIGNTPVNVHNTLIANVEGYIYEGQHYNIKEKNQDKDRNKNHERLGGIRPVARERYFNRGVRAKLPDRSSWYLVALYTCTRRC